MAQGKLIWQSKGVLLVVLPFVAASVVLQLRFFTADLLPVAIWTLGLSLLFGFVVMKLRASTPAAALSGAAITANLMLSTATVPYLPWQTALVPVLAVFLLAFAATRTGRQQKEQRGIAEHRRGRTASQVAANLGVAALASDGFVQSTLNDTGWFAPTGAVSMALLGGGLAALAEAAADTVSSEIGQVLGGRPRMVTTFRIAEPGTDGAITLVGTLAGVFAAALVAILGTMALRGNHTMLAISWAGGVFGLFFDSLLGATLEKRGWLNNDAVNFLSTASASVFAAGMLAILTHAGLD